jgi:hypothetical protein
VKLTITIEGESVAELLGTLKAFETTEQREAGQISALPDPKPDGRKTCWTPERRARQAEISKAYWRKLRERKAS